jgi:RNA polymerase sigma-70 factor, ECF subfamily
LDINEDNIQQCLATYPDAAFKFIYEKYYNLLCNISYKMLFDKNGAEDVVQEVLLDFYNKKEQIQISSSVIAYLRRSVYNRTINAIKLKSRLSADADDVLLSINDKDESQLDVMVTQEILGSVNKVIESLPEKCRLAFTLSRYEEKSYSEIAELMNTSVKTVENQIAKALKVIRLHSDLRKK